MQRRPGRPRIDLDDRYLAALRRTLSRRFREAEAKRLESVHLEAAGLPLDASKARREALALYTVTGRFISEELRTEGLGGLESRESHNRRIRLLAKEGILRSKVYEVPPRRLVHPFLYLWSDLTKEVLLKWRKLERTSPEEIRAARSMAGYTPRRRIRRKEGRYEWESLPARDRPRIKPAELTARAIVAPGAGWPVRGQWWIVRDADGGPASRRH